MALCESKLLVHEGSELKELMADVVRVRVEDGKLVAVDVLGRQLALKGYVLVEVDAIAHIIVVKRARA